MKATSLSESGSFLTLNFLQLDTEEDFDIIIKVLTQRFNTMSVMSTNGPGIMVWEFIIDGVHLRLYNDDYGNFIRATSEEEKLVIKRIHEQWCL